MSKNEKSELQVHEKKAHEQAEGTHQGPWFEPQVDIHEGPAALTLVADVPGASPETFTVDLHDSVLTISGVVKGVEPRWKPLYAEYRVGHFTRQFRLGQVVDQSKIAATVKDGVLTLELPKVEAARPRKIEIRVAP